LSGLKFIPKHNAIKMRSTFKKIYNYCINQLKEHKIGVAAVVFAVTTFLILFLFLKPYFFQPYLETKFETEEERGRFVLEQLTQ